MLRERPHRTLHGRAIIGVIALYALVLQAFLTAFVPAPPRVVGGVICAEHGVPDAPDEDGRACAHAACCTQVHALDHQASVPAASTPAARPPRATRALWRAAETVQARAPPDQGFGPRGPPTV